MATITCPRCRTENPDDRNNCQKCGVNIRPIGRLIFRLMQIVGLILILALSVGGIAIMYVQPLSILTCRYVETTQVDCQLQERIAWVIPLWETPIPHLKEAYVDRKTVTRRDEDRESDTYGKEYTVDIHRVILISDSGEIGLSGTDEIGISATLTATRINAYLNTPTNEPLTVWGFGMSDHIVVTLAGGFLFILAILMFVGWIVELVVGIDTAEAKVVGFYQKIKQKMTRKD